MTTNSKIIRNADVIVVGAGIAGLSAALESAAGGASVLVIEVNSVAGGHAVKASGFAIPGTQLQRTKGIEDSAERAYRDWVAYGETNNPEWTRLYAERANSEVYDWLTSMGVEFVRLSRTRFHLTKGKAVHVVVPMLERAFDRSNVRFLFNTRATGIITNAKRVVGLKIRSERTGEESAVYARTVILATGGFQGSVEQLLKHWPKKEIVKSRFLIGAGKFAEGEGHELVAGVGGKLTEMDRHVLFINGLPNPRDPTGKTGLVAGNKAAIWVNDQGKRFVNELGKPKLVDPLVFSQDAPGYWLVFDAPAKQFFRVGDAVWLSKASVQKEILENPKITKSAMTLDKLAEITGLPNDELQTTLARYNARALSGEDLDFGRFSKTSLRKPSQIAEPPFYAIRLYPLSRKNLGGVAVDTMARVINPAGEPIKGLYAAGELTGVAGINGKYGMSGTFLGPSVFMGRKAARTALSDSISVDGKFKRLPQFSARLTSETAEKGFWHFRQSHRIIKERDMQCEICHGAFPQAGELTRDQHKARLQVCVQCH